MLNEEDIINAVCVEFGVTGDDLRGPSRPDWIASPRMLVMALGVELLGARPRDVADWVKRDRGCGYHAVDAIKNRCEQDRYFRTRVERVKAQLKEIKLVALRRRLAVLESAEVEA